MHSMSKKALLTHLLFIIGFVVITVVLYYPYFLEGKQISQHDILQAVGGNHQLQEYREATGEEPLWMHTMFSGMPAYLNGVQFSGDLIVYAYQFVKLGMPHPQGITLVSFISFYILLLSFRVRPWIAFVGAVAFGLNGFSIISITAGHNAKIAAVALMPLVMAGIHLAFSGKRILGIGLTALALAMHLRTNHFQMTYYLLIITLVYGAFQLYNAFKDDQLKPFSISLGGLVLAAVLAVGANAGKILTVLEYSPYSIRGKSELSADAAASSGLDKEYAFRYSNGLFEPIFLFIPNFYGGASQQELSESSATADALKGAGMDRMQIRQQIKAIPTYWGDQPLTAPYYAGSAVVFLFIVGLFLLEGRNKYWLIVIAIIGIVLSWGSNFSALNTFLFDYLPGYNKFRSVTFTIIMTIIAMNLLGFMALEKLWKLEFSPALAKRLVKPLAIAGGFALLMILFAGMLSYKGAIDSRLPEWLVAAVREDRASLLRMDAFRALFIILMTAGLVWAYWKKKLSSKFAIIGLVLVIGLDVFTLSRRFLKEDLYEKNPVRSHFKPTEADTYLMNVAKDGERVLNLQNPWNEARTSYFHESVGGYHGAKMRRYQDLIEQCLGSEVSTVISGLQAGQRNFSDLPALNMLNAKYFLAGSARNAVLPNRGAMGNGWIVSNITPVSSPDEELSQVCDLDVSNAAVIDQTNFDVPEIDAAAFGEVNLISKTPNELVYQATVNGGEGLAVFSEIYYPKGWKAFSNGEELEILRVNYLLRALKLEEGQHEIKFVFEPSSVQTANVLGMISNIILILVFLGSIGFEIKNQSNQTIKAED